MYNLHTWLDQCMVFIVHKDLMSPSLTPQLRLRPESTSWLFRAFYIKMEAPDLKGPDRSRIKTEERHYRLRNIYFLKSRDPNC